MPTVFASSALWRWPPIFAAGAIAIGGLLLQSNTYLNHDLSWVLYSAGSMLDGAVFGRDIIAANPPLAWYLAMPAAALAEAIDIHPAAAFRGFVAVLSLVSLAFAWRFLKGAPFLVGRIGAAFFLIVASYSFYVGCYRDFGQREYLALILSLPYVIVAAARMDGRSCGASMAIAVGLAAGVGLALKPYFLAVPLLVELVGAMRTRSLGFPIRLETCTIVAFVGPYVASIFLMTPEYVNEVVPLLQPIYWGFDNNFGRILQTIAVGLTGFALAIYLTSRQRDSVLQCALLAAAGGFLFAYLVQMKGYSYHHFPFRSLVALSLALHLSSRLESLTTAFDRAWAARTLTVGLFLLAVVGVNANAVMGWYGSANRDTGAKAAEIGELVALVDRHAGDGHFIALSTHPYPGFPVALYATAKWGSRTNSRFFLPAIAKSRHAGSDADRAALRFAEDKARAFLLRDLALRPRLILVDARPRKHGIGALEFDIVAFYAEVPEIRLAWRAYTELEAVGGFRVFVRRSEERPS